MSLLIPTVGQIHHRKKCMSEGASPSSAAGPFRPEAGSQQTPRKLDNFDRPSPQPTFPATTSPLADFSTGVRSLQQALQCHLSILQQQLDCLSKCNVVLLEKSQAQTTAAAAVRTFIQVRPQHPQSQKCSNMTCLS
jgi:hypothetical protein